MAVVQESVLIKSYHMISVVLCSPFFSDTFDKNTFIFFLSSFFGSCLMGSTCAEQCCRFCAYIGLLLGKYHKI